MKKIIIYGLGSFAKLMRYYFEQDDCIDVVAFSADARFCNENNFNGLPIVPFESIENVYSKDDYYLFLAVGYSSMRARGLMYEKMIQKGYKTTSYISKNAFIDASVDVGINNIIFQGTQVEPFCKIGNNNIVWSSVIISHDVVIGDNNFLASQTLVGGGAEIKDGCFLGFNSAVASNIIVENETLLAAKSFLNKSSIPSSRYQGVSAKISGSHLENGIMIK